MSSHFIMEDEINESSNEDDNEPLPTKTKETISDSTAGTKRNPKIKKRKVPIINKVSHMEIEEEHERRDLEDIVAKLLSKKCVDVDEVIPFIERLHQIKQIQETKGPTDFDAIFMEEHMKELDDELTRLLDGVILGKR